jgi:hypothetical protein
MPGRLNPTKGRGLEEEGYLPSDGEFLLAELHLVAEPDGGSMSRTRQA